MFCPRCHRRYEDDHQFCPHDGDRLVKILDIKRIRAKPTEHAGQIIGERYQIRGILGKGAMARVFLAQDRSTGAPVAVKILESKHLKEPRTRARFILEAKAAAKIHHPNIIEVLDIGLDEAGAPYLVMEFLFGESLGDALRRDKTISLEVGIPFAMQIASALGAAHKEGIIHRDVKPDNVFLVGEKGEPHSVKLVDFGFAKVAEHTGVTQAGVTVGTVQYMAPEQSVSDPSDARTDVYGLGVLMYRMFSGRAPFKASDEPEMLAHQLLSEPPSPGLATSRLGGMVETVIMKTLRKVPENRYPSMDALLEDLRRLAHPGAVLAASQPLAQADVYVPKSAFGHTASRFLHTKIGRTPP